MEYTLAYSWENELNCLREGSAPPEYWAPLIPCHHLTLPFYVDKSQDLLQIGILSTSG